MPCLFVHWDRTCSHCNPFPTPLQSSPLQTVPKDGSKRRVILDLSFPKGLMEFLRILFLTSPSTSLSLVSPISSTLSWPRAQVVTFSRKIWSLRTDKSPSTPKITSFSVTSGKICYISTSSVRFGLRSATLACQRTANAIAHIFRTVYHHGCVNDIDDFGGVEASYEDALLAFSHLEDTFTSLGLESSPKKNCPPSTRMVFLGLTHDTVVMTLEVPHDKLHQTSQLLSHWLSSPRVSKSELQSLIGKLSYVCSCLHLH